ncbi:ferritin-like domain-containing protein [Candidatus Entotheonella palauensis]|uniref:ferritin-like domain-containing protein n=1 Tax=Candidatus Entotheonella palauensis TaxID=93172 RepID=UPI0015C4C80D
MDVESKSFQDIPQDPRDWKIFPRNLTARAAYIVPGNPVTTRPEDGVDNCYPGLEMDARNIQKFFFPGLYFEVYRNEGALLADLIPEDQAKQWEDLGLKKTDLNNRLYLWALKGRTAADQSADNPPTIVFEGQQGLYVWRKANALFSGKTAVVIGPNPPVSNDRLTAALHSLENDVWPHNKSIVHHNIENGVLEWAVLVHDRARYLDDEGVLDPDVYEPGDLTRTLCTPWTFDFRDCQCFYWASNKPDVVSSEDGQYEYLNFQRKNRHVEPQTEDIAYAYNARRQREIDYAEMMIGWEQLRPVLNGREFGQTYVPPAPPPLDKPLSLEHIKEEVAYLATVEHALIIQYLYGYYSVDAPVEEPRNPSLKTFRLQEAAKTIFDIAIDEMRHFLWANEILRLLGAPTTAKRASLIGRRFRVPFYLQSLTSPQLQWFIDVERPSRSTEVGLDGMYVGILLSLQHLTDQELDPEIRRRAVEIVKLIVDEGEGHYVRFSTAQQNFAFYDDAARGPVPSYIRSGHWRNPSTNRQVSSDSLYGAPVQAPAGSPEATLQRRSDDLYHSLLRFLKVAFAMRSETKSGEALRYSIHLMGILNATNLQLAKRGATPLFTLPPGWEADPPVTNRAEAARLLAEAKELLQDIEMPAAEFLHVRPDIPGSGSVAEVLAYFESAVETEEFRG